jgi:hypothetical protein
VGPELIARCSYLGLRIASPDGDFLRAVAAGRPASPSLRDAVRPHRLVDAIYRSAAEGGRVVAVSRVDGSSTRSSDTDGL